jgi:hypothetical protein
MVWFTRVLIHLVEMLANQDHLTGCPPQDSRVTAEAATIRVPCTRLPCTVCNCL